MAFALCLASCPKAKENASLVLNTNSKLSCRSRMKFPITGVLLASSALPGAENPKKFLLHKVKELAQRQKALLGKEKSSSGRPDLDLSLAQIDWIPNSDLLNVAYDRCRELFVEEREPFAFGTLLLKPEKQKPIWATWAVQGHDGRIQVGPDEIQTQMWGLSPDSKASLETIYSAAIDLGVALCTIDALRDVREDARMGRIYLPQDELADAGLTDDDIYCGKVTDKWRNFMQGQMKRARGLLDEAGEKLIAELHPEDRWAMWTNILIYGQDLDVIVANGYDNLTKKPSAGKPKKLVALLVAYGKSLGL